MLNPRARFLGIPFEGTPGRLNAITDVRGVTVGHTTLISGEGKLRVGKGPIRTGVTAVLPRGKNSDPVFAAWHALNGCGEMTGTLWVEESGFLYGPVMITNLGVSVVRDATTGWGAKYISHWFSLPVVAETYDGSLNDIRAFMSPQEHVWHALDSARSGAVAEGNGRRNWNDLPRFQRRHWDCVSKTGEETGWLYRRRARASESWRQKESDNRWRSGRFGNH